MTFHFSTFTTAPLDFEKLKAHANKDPIDLLERCRERRREIKHGTRYLGWQHIVACYAAASAIRDDAAHFEDLTKHELFLKRAYRPKLRDVLRLCLLIGTNADIEGPTHKRACDIAKKLASSFQAKVTPETLMRGIEAAKGLEGLTRGKRRNRDDIERVVAIDDSADAAKPNGGTVREKHLIRMPAWANEIDSVPALSEYRKKSAEKSPPLGLNESKWREIAGLIGELQKAADAEINARFGD